MNAFAVSKNGQRFTSFGPPTKDWFNFICQISGGKFRIFFKWNNSFHDAQFYPGAIFGPAVRHPKPITWDEFCARVDANNAKAIRFWQNSRNFN